MSMSWDLQLLGSTDNWSSNKVMMGVSDCDLIGDRVMNNVQGKRGKRQMYGCRSAQVGENVSGGFTVYPTATELEWILARMLGWGTTGPWVNVNALASVNLWAKKSIQTFKYTGCRLNQLVLSGQQADFIRARCDFMGESETEVSDLSLTGVAIDCAPCFGMGTLVLTIGGTAFSIKSFQLSINQNIVPNQQENALTRTIFEAGELEITLGLTCGYRSDTKALYRRTLAGDAATLAITNGTNTYSLGIPFLQIPGNGPKVPEQGEMTMDLVANCFATTGTDVLTITKS